MGKVLISFKNKLIAEAFYQFFVEKLKPNWEIDIKPEAGKNYDIIIFDKNSLKELSQEAYPESKNFFLMTEPLKVKLFFYFYITSYQGLFPVRQLLKIF